MGPLRPSSVDAGSLLSDVKQSQMIFLSVLASAHAQTGQSQMVRVVSTFIIW